MILYDESMRHNGYLIAHKMNRPEDMTTLYLTQSHSDFLGWLVICDGCGDFSQTFINAEQARDLAEALVLFADELDANRDAILEGWG